MIECGYAIKTQTVVIMKRPCNFSFTIPVKIQGLYASA